MDILPRFTGGKLTPSESRNSIILEPFSIQFASPILQFRVLKTSRPVVGFRVEEIPGNLILIDNSVTSPLLVLDTFLYGDGDARLDPRRN